MEIEKSENKVHKIEPVYLDVNSMILNSVEKFITELSDKVYTINKQIRRSPIVTRWIFEMKLKRAEDKLQLQKMLYDKLKKEYSKK